VLLTYLRLGSHMHTDFVPHLGLITSFFMRCRNRNTEYLQYILWISALVWILAWSTLSEAEDPEENKDIMEAE